MPQKPKSLFDARENFSKASLELLGVTRRLTESLPQKVLAMQEIYLERNENLYTSEELKYLRYYLRVVTYKFYLAAFHLEQLWSIGDSGRFQILGAMRNSLEKLDCSDDEELFHSFALEGFLFQARSFLDFIMIYFCLVLKTGHFGMMSRKTFYKELEKVTQEPFLSKANRVKQYFDEQVFGDNPNAFPRSDWGKLLKDLRDKIAHRDRVRPSLKSNEILAGGVLFNWPTLQGLTYDRFCQEMENGMFFLITELLSDMYNLEWKAGPYKPNLWE